MCNADGMEGERDAYRNGNVAIKTCLGPNLAPDVSRVAGNYQSKIKSRQESHYIIYGDEPASG